MIKQVRYILGTWMLLLVIVLNVSFISNAYTEEEKQQAKAWLSAHGYSPDMSGANQAYQDYLNGKFDEELGYDTNGDGSPAATPEGTSQSSEEITTETENSTTESAAKQKQGSSTATIPSDEETTEVYKLKDPSAAESEQQTEEQSKMTEAELEKGETVKQKSAEQQEMENAALNRSERKEIDRNVVFVIVIIILAILLLVYLYIKYVQKKRDIQ